MNCPIGIPDNEFVTGKLPILEQEIRVLMLAKAQIQSGDVIVDVGAGNGSLSVEAALQTETGTVFALESKNEGLALIITNAAKFGIKNICPIMGQEPQTIKNITIADVVLVGGNSAFSPEILERAGRLLRMGGRMVLAVTTEAALSDVLTQMRLQSDFFIEIFGVQVTRISENGVRSEPVSPIYIITCTKTCKQGFYKDSGFDRVKSLQFTAL